jgi:signal transduction histidine kinase
MIWPGESKSEVGGPGSEDRDPARFAMDQALAIVVHEMRSPIGVIRNAVEILRLNPPADPAVEQQYRAIERQVGHLGRLVVDLLELSRVATGKLSLREEWLDLAGVFDHALEACRPLIEQKQQRLSVSLPSEHTDLLADPVRLHQVLVNLLTNAVKYTDRGGCIWMTADLSSVGLTVTVRDTGIGIEPEDLPHVFDLFHQGTAPECETQSGLGIGLALVRWLVELHGGSIMASSGGPGKGSEFVVRWPTVRRLAATPAMLALGAPQGQDATGPVRYGATLPQGRLREAETDPRTIIPALCATGARSARREAGSWQGR